MKNAVVLYSDLLNDGVILGEHDAMVNMAFRSAFGLPHWRMNSPRAAMLERVTEWVWAQQRETNGLELGGRFDLMPEDEDDEQDGDNGPEDFGYTCESEGWRILFR